MVSTGTWPAAQNPAQRNVIIIMDIINLNSHVCIRQYSKQVTENSSKGAQSY